MLTAERMRRTDPRGPRPWIVRLLPGHLGHVAGHVLRVATLEEPGRHPLLPGASDPDGVQHPLPRDLPALVEVRPRHAPGIHRVQVVAARARLPEDLLALLILRGELGLTQ